jgi:hypothetical protein
MLDADLLEALADSEEERQRAAGLRAGVQAAAKLEQASTP